MSILEDKLIKHLESKIEKRQKKKIYIYIYIYI